LIKRKESQRCPVHRIPLTRHLTQSHYSLHRTVQYPITSSLLKAYQSF